MQDHEEQCLSFAVTLLLKLKITLSKKGTNNQTNDIYAMQN